MLKKMEIRVLFPEVILYLQGKKKNYASAKNNYSTLVRRRQTT